MEGQLIIRARKGLKLYMRNSSGDEKKEIVAPYRDGRYLVELDRSLGTYWLMLQ